MIIWETNCCLFSKGRNYTICRSVQWFYHLIILGYHTVPVDASRRINLFRGCEALRMSRCWVLFDQPKVEPFLNARCTRLHLGIRALQLKLNNSPGNSSLVTNHSTNNWKQPQLETVDWEDRSGQSSGSRLHCYEKMMGKKLRRTWNLGYQLPSLSYQRPSTVLAEQTIFCRTARWIRSGQFWSSLRYKTFSDAGSDIHMTFDEPRRSPCRA